MYLLYLYVSKMYDFEHTYIQYLHIQTYAFWGIHMHMICTVHMCLYNTPGYIQYIHSHFNTYTYALAGSLMMSSTAPGSRDSVLTALAHTGEGRTVLGTDQPSSSPTLCTPQADIVIYSGLLLLPPADAASDERTWCCACLPPAEC